MVNVTPTWAPVGTDEQRHDRRSCHDLPRVDSTSPAAAGGGVRWMVTAACHPARLSLFLRLSPDSRNIKIRRKERPHEAQGCERGARTSWGDLLAPVTSRPTLSRGP